MPSPRIQIYTEQHVIDHLTSAADSQHLKLTAWALSVLKREADKALGVTPDPTKQIEREINKLSDQISESHTEFMSEIQKLTQPFQE